MIPTLLVSLAADLPQMHLTFACREEGVGGVGGGKGGGGGVGGQDDLVKAKEAAQRRGGAQLVNTLADASPPLTTTVQLCKPMQRTVEMDSHQLCKAKGCGSKVALMCQNFGR